MARGASPPAGVTGVTVIDDPTGEVSEERARAEAKAVGMFAMDHVVPAVALLLELGEEYGQLLSVAVPALPPGLVADAVAFGQNGWIEQAGHADASWVVISEALALIAISRDPDASELAVTGRRLEDAPWWVSERWDERCAARVVELGEVRRCLWVRALRGTPIRDVEVRPSSPVRVVRHEPPWVLQNPLQLWHEQPVTAQALQMFAPFRILRLIEPEWLRLIDEWLDPRFVQGAMYQAEIRQSAARIVRLLGVSGACFDDLGTPTGRSAAIILCEAALAMLEVRLQKMPEQREEATRDACAFAAALVERSDGPFLAVGLNTWLVGRTLLRKSPSVSTTEASRLVLGAVSDCLKKRGVKTADHRRFAAVRAAAPVNPCPPWQRELPALLASARAVASTDEEHVRDFRQWLRIVLSTPSEWFWTDAFVIVAEGLGIALARENDPASVCRQLFEELEPQRRRGEFARTRSELPRTLPSLVLLYVLADLVKEGHVREPEAALAYVVDRARRIALTYPMTLELHVKPLAIVATGIGVACSQFGATDERTVRLLRSVSGDVRALGTVIAHMGFLGRDRRAEMLAAVQMPFETLCRGVEEISGATGSPVDSGLLSALRELEASDALDVGAIVS